MPAYRGEMDSVIHPFVDAMKVKLAMSRHRGKDYRASDLPTLFERLKGEVAELEEAITLGNTIEIMLEAADIANYAMFISDVAIREAQKEDDRQQKLDV